MKKIFFLIVIFSTLSLSLAENRPIGYKIVLSSYSSFAEAKQNLLKHKMTHYERKIYQKYGCSMVARSSGKLYILAIEPIKNEADAKKIASHYKSSYKHTMVSRYYGPTSGSVFQEIKNDKSPNSHKQSDVNDSHDNIANGSLIRNKNELKKNKQDIYTDEILSSKNETENVLDQSENKNISEENKINMLWLVLFGLPFVGALSGVMMNRFLSR